MHVLTIARQLFVRGVVVLIGASFLALAFVTLGSSESASGQETGPVGVVGCSNTLQAVMGYRSLSELDRLALTPQGGETIVNWAESSRPWRRYDDRRPGDGYSAVWLNLCELAQVGLSRQNVDLVLQKIWLRDPGVTVYVSPLNFYEQEECQMTNGNVISSEGADMADALSSQLADVVRGPDLGPLPSSGLAEDSCHLSPEGERLVGSQLVAFFDGAQPETTTTTPTTTTRPPSTTEATSATTTTSRDVTTTVPEEALASSTTSVPASTSSSEGEVPPTTRATTTTVGDGGTSTPAVASGQPEDDGGWTWLWLAVPAVFVGSGLAYVVSRNKPGEDSAES